MAEVSNPSGRPGRRDGTRPDLCCLTGVSGACSVLYNNLWSAIVKRRYTVDLTGSLLRR